MRNLTRFGWAMALVLAATAATFAPAARAQNAATQDAAADATPKNPVDTPEDAEPGADAEADAEAPKTLKIGDASPKIWVSGWWKEKVPAPREKGKVYVVDFWASWCPPCREAMPHLIDMADKYGDYADFIAISTDRDSRAAAQFLNSLPAETKIYFALDKNRQSWRDWATAAGRTTIPTTFVLDEDGKVFWIGHTMEVEAPLKKLLIK